MQLNIKATFLGICALGQFATGSQDEATRSNVEKRDVEMAGEQAMNLVARQQGCPNPPGGEFKLTAFGISGNVSIVENSLCVTKFFVLDDTIQAGWARTDGDNPIFIADKDEDIVSEFDNRNFIVSLKDGVDANSLSTVFLIHIDNSVVAQADISSGEGDPAACDLFPSPITTTTSSSSSSALANVLKPAATAGAVGLVGAAAFFI